MGKQRRIVLAMLAALAILGVGIAALGRRHRNPDATYAEALRSINAGCDDVREFARLFPSSTTYISHYNGQSGTPEWIGEVKTKRVEIAANMSIDLDSQRRKVVRFGRMNIVVLRVARVEVLPDGRAMKTYAGQVNCSLAELRTRLNGISDPTQILEELAR